VLAVEMNEIGKKRLGVQLTEQCRDLSAVVGAVVDHMLHGLPKGVFVFAEGESAVLMNFVQVVLRKFGDKFVQALLVLLPARFQSGDIGELSSFG
jgi:hypothetical protein